MKRWLFLLGLLLIPSVGQAQGIPFAVNPPAPNAQLTVCSAPATGNPCTNRVNIYGDVALTQLITQPALIGATGAYTFFYASASAPIQVQISGRPDQIVGGGGGSGIAGCTQPGGAGSLSCPNNVGAGSFTVGADPGPCSSAGSGAVFCADEGTASLPIVGKVICDANLADNAFECSANGGPFVSFGAGGLPMGTTVSGLNVAFPGNICQKGNPTFDVTCYGASGSAQRTTVTTTGGNPIVTVASAVDFMPNQGVFIYGAGTGGDYFCTTISSISGTSFTLATAPPSSVVGANMYHDDQVAEQAAIDAASAASLGPLGTGAGIVNYPLGTFQNTCTPVHIHSPNIRIVGAGMRSTVIANADNNYTSGPGFIMSQPPSTYIPAGYMGAALLTGTGNSFNIAAGGSGFWLDFRQCGGGFVGASGLCGEVGGKSQLTVEAAINLTTLTQDVGVIVSSGQRDSILGYQSAFALVVKANGALQCMLHTTGSTQTITGNAGGVTTGSTIWVAMDYDGSNLRCYIAGTQVTNSPKAQTGTVVQDAFEVVRTSGDHGWFQNPSSAPNFKAMDGRLDGPRISKIARYAGNFTAPTVKWSSPDSNVLIQCNFDNQQDIYTVCKDGNGHSQNIPFWNSGCSGIIGGDVAISELQIGNYNDGALLFTTGSSSTIEHVAFGASSRNGYWLGGAGCSYYNHFDDLNVVGPGGRYGLVGQTGISEYNHIAFGQGNPVVTGFFGTNNTYNNIFLSSPSNGTAYSLIFQNRGSLGGSSIEGITDYTKISGINTDVEGAAASMIGAVMVDGGGKVLLESSLLECGGNANCIPLTLSNVVGAEISGVGMGPGSNLTAPIHIFGSNQPGTSTPYFPNMGVTIRNSHAVSQGGIPLTHWLDTGSAITFNSVPPANEPNTLADIAPNTMNFGSAPITQELPIDTGTNGIFALGVVKWSGATGKVTTTATTDANGALGCSTQRRDYEANSPNQPTTGFAEVILTGQAYCIPDNAVTIGDYIILSSTLAGAVHDFGAASTMPPLNNQIVGRAMSTGVQISVPSSTTASCPSTGGTIGAGTYQVSTTYVNSLLGETTVARTSVVCSGTTSSILASPNGNFFTTTAEGIIGFRTYISAAGGGAGSETLQPINSTVCGSANAVITLPGNKQACQVKQIRQLYTVGAGNATFTSVSAGAAIPSSNTAFTPVTVFSGGAQMYNLTQPTAINSGDLTAAVSTATLCAAAAGACNQAGQYEVHFDFIETGTACGTPGTGGVTFLLTWTDANGTTHSAVSLGMDDASAINAVSQTFHFQTALGTAWASGQFTLSSNGSVIQYATGYTACGVGTGTYRLQASVVRLQ